MPERLKIRSRGLKPVGDLHEIMEEGWGSVIPIDAKHHNQAGLKTGKGTHVPWLYDRQYGWTPGEESTYPRPDLQLPLYFLDNFPLKTRGLKEGKENLIRIDCRRFPSQARVFMVFPASIFPNSLLSTLAEGDVLPGRKMAVVSSIDDFNTIFNKAYNFAVDQDTVVTELISGCRAILTGLELSASDVNLEVFYGVLREHAKPKTHYEINFDQFIDGRPVGNFDHIFQAYHNYDVPIIGDRRNLLAYRRTDPEVSNIPPGALAFFDTWQVAVARGFDFVPQAYGKHYRLGLISSWLTSRILKFFNDPELTVDRIVQEIEDNCYVDMEGQAEEEPTQKIGITRPTAEEILRVRSELPEGIFGALAQIDEVHGIGPDTLSDIITSFLLRDRPEIEGDWEVDDEVARLLGAKIERQTQAEKVESTESTETIESTQSTEASPTEIQDPYILRVLLNFIAAILKRLIKLFDKIFGG